MTEWVRTDVVLAIHDEQIAEHGGSSGVRDPNLLESALARPQQLEAYGEPQPDIVALAAAYAFGIARNHAFIDGNKRTSYAVTQVFLTLNGFELLATEAERLEIWVKLGAGELTEAALGEWLGHRVRPTT